MGHSRTGVGQCHAANTCRQGKREQSQYVACVIADLERARFPLAQHTRFKGRAMHTVSKTQPCPPLTSRPSRDDAVNAVRVRWMGHSKCFHGPPAWGRKISTCFWSYQTEFCLSGGGATQAGDHRWVSRLTQIFCRHT